MKLYRFFLLQNFAGPNVKEIFVFFKKKKNCVKKSLRFKNKIKLIIYVIFRAIYVKKSIINNPFTMTTYQTDGQGSFNPHKNPISKFPSYFFSPFPHHRKIHSGQSTTRWIMA
jgi:hypothetical protein